MLNYSTHAIEEVLKGVPIAIAQGRRIDAAATLRFVEHVRKAEKFVLPDHGALIYDLVDIPDGIEITRLPFSTIVMEVPFPPLDRLGKSVHPSSKRLILAREGVYERMGTPFRTSMPGEEPNAIKIDVACWLDEPRTWFLQMTGAIVMVGTKSRSDVPIEDDDPFRDDKLGNTSFDLVTEATLPEMEAIVHTRVGERLYRQSAGQDVATEVRILAEMLAVLECSNVGTEIEQPPEKLQRTRLKHRREPFYGVHVLTVGNASLSQGSRAAEGGDFAVRQHVRRGHIRRLGDGRRIWVNQTVVAAGSGKGRSEKVYRVKA